MRKRVIRNLFPAHPAKLFPALVPALGAVLLAGCGGAGKEPNSKIDPPVVRVVTAESLSAASGRTYAATVTARKEVRRGFQVGGKIAARHVDIGDRVSIGDVLAVLDEVDLELAVQAARADLQAASATLRTVTADEARLRDLVAPGAVSQSAYDQQTAALTSARERVRQLQARLDLALNARGYTELQAGSDGVVTALLAERGEVVAAGQPIVALALTSELEAEAYIPESRLAQADEAAAELTLWANPDARYPLKLRELAPQADPVTRTYRARFSIPKGSSARLGMTGAVHLASDAGVRIALPQAAVFSVDGRPAVWVVGEDDRIERRVVELERYEGDMAFIAAGVERGERVVVYGAHLLQPEQLVRPDPGPTSRSGFDVSALSTTRR